MSDFYTEKIKKARKEHKCFWCKKIIVKSESYNYVASVFQGDFGCRKECLTCSELIKDYTCSDYYDADCGIEDDGLQEMWRDTKCVKCKNLDLESEECNSEKGIEVFGYVRCEQWESI